MPCTKDYTKGIQHKVIDIHVQEQDSKDYHDLVLQVLDSLCIRLWGGYYEPYSDRDKQLGDALAKFLQEYKTLHKTQVLTQGSEKLQNNTYRNELKGVS